MKHFQNLDKLVRHRLGAWPQCPPGLSRRGTDRNAWLRARPTQILDPQDPVPYLKWPGTKRFRTMPDGLWINFGGTPVEPFVDIFVVEACSSLTNLFDKRSRFAPSTQSMLVVCPLGWLLARVSAGDETPRWQATGVLRFQPVQELVLPVRDIRVMYGLKAVHYAGIAESHVPQPHEYFVPMERLTAAESEKDPELRALVARASANSNFFASV